MSAGLLAAAFLFGIGFGVCVHRAGICFAFGLGEIFVGKGKRIVRLFLAIFIVSATGFLLTGCFSEALGLKPVGEIRGYGFYNLLAGMLFGAGIFLCGGCILGSLRRLGEGDTMYLVVLISMIPGMALVVFVLNPLLSSRYSVQTPLIPELLGVPAVWVTGVLVLVAVFALLRLRPALKARGEG